MNNINDMSTSSHSKNEINLGELFEVLWKGKWLILTTTSFLSILSIIYSLSLPNIYESKALLNPIGEQSQLNKSVQSFGGLASLAGINLPATGSNAIKAKEKLYTLSFFTDNILPNIYLPDLMAVKFWDTSNNKIVYDESIFNEANQSWVRDVKNLIPSPQESYRQFIDKLQVSEDISTGFVTISVQHQSPIIAKEWVELVVNEINYFFRVKDKLEAQAAMDYLSSQMTQTSFAEIKQVIAELLQQKMQQLTLVEATNYYVYEYIDPPVIMEEKSQPARAIICIMGALFGAFFGVLIVLIRFYIIKIETNNL